MNEEKGKIIERVGIALEKAGLPPLPGRVFAYLLVAEPSHKTFFEIQEDLQASKSAVSNALNLLMNKGAVEYTTFLGDRKRYFRLNAAKWYEEATNRIPEALGLRQLLEDALATRAPETDPELVAGIRKIMALQDYIARNWPRFVADFEKQYAGR
jgi:predicted transcriptional regulator